MRRWRTFSAMHEARRRRGAAGIACLMLLSLVPVSVAGASETSTSLAASTAGDRTFVSASHQAFLGRDATYPEIEDWVARFASGTPRAALSEALANSDEWLTSEVRELYDDALHREPDPGGLIHWVGELRRGVPVNRVGAQIYGSAEYYQNAGGTDPAFVSDLFVRILDRSADQAGLDFWTGEINRRGRGDVAGEFFKSVESRAGRVDALYRRLLARSPDPGGRIFWTQQLSRVNDVRLAIRLASSSEFYARAKSDCLLAPDGAPEPCDPTAISDGTSQLVPQVNPAHTGVSPTTISPDARVRWSRDVSEGERRGMAVGTPVISGDLVIAPVMYGSSGSIDVPREPNRVFAFDRLTGEVRWSSPIDPGTTLRISAGGGLVFALGDAKLVALRMTDGTPLWETAVNGYPQAPPIATGGDVYITTNSFVGIEVIAFDAGTGTVRWRSDVERLDTEASPTVRDGVVYLAGSCGHAEALRRSDGHELWHHDGPCHGGGATDPVAAHGRVYVGENEGRVELDGEPGDENRSLVLDQETGELRATFLSRFDPVVSHNEVITVTGSGIENHTVDTRSRRWRHQFSFENSPSQQPVIAGGTIFTTTQDPADVRNEGDLVGLRRDDGTESLRLPLGTLDAGRSPQPRDIAAANHVLAIPYGSRLILVG